jgi:MinD superfamily P-loop ATPase
MLRIATPAAGAECALCRECRPSRQIHITTVSRGDTAAYQTSLLCEGCASVVAEAFAALAGATMRAVVRLGAAQNFNVDHARPRP